MAFVAGTAVAGGACGRRGAVVCGRRRAVVCMAGTAAENRAARVELVDKVRGRLEASEMVLCAPMDGMTVAQMNELKGSVPEGTTVMCVKNTLMRRAVDDGTPEAASSWTAVESMTSNSNMWFFVESDVKGTVDAFKKFLKNNKRDHGIKGGVVEGQLYDTTGIEAIAKLPSKQELYQKIAVLLNVLPAKVGRAINAVPSKVVRSIKLATVPDDAPDS
mmetsp:Transcript_53738/g.131706  ORF Transcript_53738/g.131706 Transcript_53738/m.131706 type:complete len:218 (-) Transcript_53738:46-699(-)